MPDEMTVDDKLKVFADSDAAFRASMTRSRDDLEAALSAEYAASATTNNVFVGNEHARQAYVRGKTSEYAKALTEQAGVLDAMQADLEARINAAVAEAEQIRPEAADYTDPRTSAQTRFLATLVDHSVEDRTRDDLEHQPASVWLAWLRRTPDHAARAGLAWVEAQARQRFPAMKADASAQEIKALDDLKAALAERRAARVPLAVREQQARFRVLAGGVVTPALREQARTGRTAFHFPTRPSGS